MCKQKSHYLKYYGFFHFPTRLLYVGIYFFEHDLQYIIPIYNFFVFDKSISKLCMYPHRLKFVSACCLLHTKFLPASAATK